MAKGKRRNLERALGSFLNQEKLNGFLAQVFIEACKTGKVSYDEIEEIARGDSEDVLLLGFEWRLLIPVRSARDTLEWDDAVLLPEPGETYKMPNVVKYLVEEAIQTGRWEPESAIAEILKVMGESEWEKMPKLVQKLGEESQYYRTNATQIKKICREFDLEDRVDSLIAELKGSGVMSPKLSSLAEVIREGSPIYELNPSLFAKINNQPKKRTYGSFGEFLADLKSLSSNISKLSKVRLGSPDFRERLMLSVSEVYGCRYCSYFHTMEEEKLEKGC